MKLIGSLTSPYVRKARIVLAEKKIEYEFELDSPWTAETKVPNFNPLGKIPVLVLDDSTVLFDSRVIVEYIDSAAPNSKLTPTSNRDRAEVKRWGAVADGICDAAALVFLEKNLHAKVLITSLESLSDALGGQGGTWIVPRRQPEVLCHSC